MAVADYTTLVQQIYISYFGRPADPLGLFNYAATLDAAKAPTTAAGLATAYNTVPSIKALVDSFASAPESVALYGSASNLAFVTSIYANVLNRTPDVAGLTYWVGEVASGRVSKAAAALNIMNGALENKSAQGLIDAKVLANKVTISNNFDAVLNTDGTKLSSYDGDAAAAAAREMLKTVTATTDVNAFQSTINTTIDGLVAKPNVGVSLSLGVTADNLIGTVGNDTILARVVDNQNTFQSGDKINGGAGVDRLEADIGVSQKFAIRGETINVETAAFSVQAQGVGNTVGGTDSGNNNPSTFAGGVQIDAQRMVGVNQWESHTSRGDLLIEDVRILDSQITKDITIAMVETDPGHVDFGVYFNQYSLRAQTNATSELRLQLLDTRSVAQGRGPLEQSPYDGFIFNYKGVATTVRSPAIDAAQTYDALLVAVKAAIAAIPALAAVEATLGNTFTVTDGFGALVSGREIVLKSTNGDSLDATQAPGGTALGWVANGAVPPSSGLFTNMTVASSSGTDLVTAKVILDDVGSGSTGGDLVIGGMSVGQTSSSQGVQRFEIEVRDNSKLETIASTNNTLKEVSFKNGVTTSNIPSAYVESVKDKGNLTVNGNSGTNGAYFAAGTAGDAATGNNVVLPGTVASNNYGFSDVRVLDGSAFVGKLAYTAEITTASYAKYINLVDTAASSTVDTVNFNYTGGTNDDVINVTIDGNILGSQSKILAGREDFALNIDGANGNDTIIVKMVAPGSSALGVDQTFGDFQAWYANQDMNDNIRINGGAGNDTIRKLGAGDANIDGGVGDDVIYSDNSGSQIAAVTAITATSGAVATPNAGKAVFLFNTNDQNTVVTGNTFAERNINDIRSGTNEAYNMYNTKLVVTFKGLPSVTVTLAGAGYKTSDLQINQAIKAAINTDPTLKALLVAKDGPANSLMVESLIDGAMVPANLSIALALPAVGSLTTGDIAAAAAAYGLPVGSNEAAVLTAMNTAFNAFTAKADYNTVLATTGAAGVEITGNNSITTSDNIITGGAGNDIIVLGTTGNVGTTTTSASSNEVVKFAAGFGNDVIVNFAATGFGIDHFDMSAFLGTNAVTVGALANTNGLVTVIAEAAATNGTAALIKGLVDAGGVTATATKQVYIAYDAQNVGKVYSIVNGTGAADAIVTLEGTIDLADTAWATLTAANFIVPTLQAEGGATQGVNLLATAPGQTLLGTTGVDTFGTAGFINTTMTGGTSNDTFNVNAAGAVITDLATGDIVNVTAAGVVAANNVAAFSATTSTTNAGAVTLNSAAAGSTISMASAAGTVGYTFVGGAGVDTLTGSAFADTFTGAAGNDTFTGGAGNDTFNVDSGTDIVTDLGTGDIVVVSATGILSATSVSAFTATAATSNAGTATLNAIAGGSTINMALAAGPNGYVLVGGAGVDNITGSAFNDTITGGAGSDIIATGLGNDTVVFNSLVGSDTISDYVVANDSVQLSKAAFAGLGVIGALTAAEFESGAGLVAAATAAGRIVYDTTAGALFYDADGLGGVAAVQIATLTGAPVMVFGEFAIIA